MRETPAPFVSDWNNRRVSGVCVPASLRPSTDLDWPSADLGCGKCLGLLAAKRYSETLNLNPSKTTPSHSSGDGLPLTSQTRRRWCIFNHLRDPQITLSSVPSPKNFAGAVYTHVGLTFRPSQENEHCVNRTRVKTLQSERAITSARVPRLWTKIR